MQVTSAIRDPLITGGKTLKDVSHDISRHVESNDAKILSAYVSPDELDPYKIKLTLKINTTDLTRIIATLERFEYRIIAQYQESADNQADKDRYDLLLKYLNM